MEDGLSAGRVPGEREAGERQGMGWFGRRRREEPVVATGTPDPHLKVLDVAHADRLRSLALRAFAELGLEVVLDGDAVVAADGREFGLHSVARACRVEPMGDWPALVRAHVAAIASATSGTDDLRALTIDEAAPRAYLRLVDGSQVLPWMATRQVTEDLHEVLALDCPDSVALLNVDTVERLGERALREAAVLNLLAVGFDEVVRLDGPGGAVLRVGAGDSVYTASKLLVVPDVLRRLLGEEHAAPHGVLAAMMSWQELVVHVVADASVVPALETLVRSAGANYAERPHAVSPHVFWWHDGVLRQLTRVTEDGRTRVEVGPDFAEVLHAVTG